MSPATYSAVTSRSNSANINTHHRSASEYWPKHSIVLEQSTAQPQQLDYCPWAEEQSVTRATSLVILVQTLGELDDSRYCIIIPLIATEHVPQSVSRRLRSLTTKRKEEEEKEKKTTPCLN